MKIFPVHGELGATVLETIVATSGTRQSITSRVLGLDSQETRKHKAGSSRLKEEMTALVDDA